MHTLYIKSANNMIQVNMINMSNPLADQWHDSWINQHNGECMLISYRPPSSLEMMSVMHIPSNNCSGGTRSRKSRFEYNCSNCEWVTKLEIVLIREAVYLLDT
ncbi:unnamed protein product [Gordionus sp. m RMFG-2023]